MSFMLDNVKNDRDDSQVAVELDGIMKKYFRQ
jgi:hypothetical protein